MFQGLRTVIYDVSDLEKAKQWYASIQDVGEHIKVATVLDPFGNIFGIIYNPNFKN
ncbi:MAG: hypothetical protein MUD14_29185 [Hydrococcus sp. Prado102]|jgi:hypothetical protein|nr:hypothetical protein [Hydrococcus sp. Prado102]